MGSATSTTSLSILVLLSLIIAQSFSWHVNGRRFLVAHTTIHLINELPQQSDIFKVHCSSKKDDLGLHDVSKSSPFKWSFNEFFRSFTVYNCKFWWNSKEKDFDVYGGKIYVKGYPILKRVHPGKYYYYVRSDGFYLSRIDHGDSPNARKVVNW